jgi:hypothetical protein
MSSLDGQLMRPRCRIRRVVVMFQPPTSHSADEFDSGLF